MATICALLLLISAVFTFAERFESGTELVDGDFAHESIKRQTSAGDVHIYLCTQQTWAGNCSTLASPNNTCSSVPAPWSTDNPGDIGNAGVYSVGPDPGLTCYFYNSAACDASQGISYPIIYPGYANAQNFPEYSWTYGTMIIPKAWLCVRNPYDV